MSCVTQEPVFQAGIPKLSPGPSGPDVFYHHNRLAPIGVQEALLPEHAVGILCQHHESRPTLAGCGFPVVPTVLRLADAQVGQDHPIGTVPLLEPANVQDEARISVRARPIIRVDSRARHGDRLLSIVTRQPSATIPAGSKPVQGREA